MMAAKWGIPPPVLEWGMEHGGWSHWYHLATDLYALEAECAESRSRSAQGSDHGKPVRVTRKR